MTQKLVLLDPTIISRVTVITWAQLGMGWPASRAVGNGRRWGMGGACLCKHVYGAGGYRAEGAVTLARNLYKRSSEEGFDCPSLQSTFGVVIGRTLVDERC
ncbi:hypothetical protein DdX_20317 [Ditylenchus destructor]|uniref:Uncharacterized protein n=1 Tax=Ditylenchus destructor TaxID=166010 RepID=A0AAD4QTP5_9BILA|nr:hypothetical protein DdX_20317 [Ditylenchus destructor]